MADRTLHQECRAALKRMESENPGLRQVLEKAYGYAVFPDVGKAAAVIGGAYGTGEVYEEGSLIGYATISQLTIGVQIGGDAFTEVIVFDSKQSLERFKRGETKFAANASAVLVRAGAATSNDFEDGVCVFVSSEGGMLLEAAIGGQAFEFKPGRGGSQRPSQKRKAGRGHGRRAGERSGTRSKSAERTTGRSKAVSHSRQRRR